MPFRISAQLAWQTVGDEVILVDLDTGRALGLNRPGSLIWSMLEEHDEETIVGELTRRFAVDPPVARSDYHGFVEQLCARSYIAPC